MVPKQQMSNAFPEIAAKKVQKHEPANELFIAIVY